MSGLDAGTVHSLGVDHPLEAFLALGTESTWSWMSRRNSSALWLRCFELAVLDDCLLGTGEERDDAAKYCCEDETRPVRRSS